MSHAMSDDQVAAELKKMTAFIRQEALEKAHEIQLKADEEFAIEKSKLVREETSSIDSEYEKKFKQASMSQQITRSTVSNKTRLKVLGARQSLLDKLFEDARKKLPETTKSDDYEGLLKGLILEGLYMMAEKKVVIRCREQDKDKVQSALKGASEEYKENMSAESEGSIDEKNWLPEESSGGVWVVGSAGRIELNNTLDERLKMCETDALPTIRAALFGENANRKFHD